MIKLVLLSSIVFAAGIGIPIMAAINAGLGMRLASPTFATAILMFVGLIVSTSVIDHFGLFGAIKTPISAQKGLGIALMTLGIILARKIT